MATEITDRLYLDMQEKVKAMLIRALKFKAISIEELMAVLYILGQTSTSSELETFIDIFSDSFPVLTDVTVSARAEARGLLEEKVKKVIASIVQKDPLRATEIAKAALKPGVTWEELSAEYPELKEQDPA